MTMETASDIKYAEHNLAVQDNANIIQLEDFYAGINNTKILDGINLSLPEKQVTCIVGPSGSGKSTLIRSINRINDEVPGFWTKGNIDFGKHPVHSCKTNTAWLRSQIGMVFQKPCVFPKSIKENVLFGINHLKKLSKADKLQVAEHTLKTVSLWDEVAHRLHEKANGLSAGQQQRLCIARTLAIEPQVIFLDEPTSSLDPKSTRSIEDMMVNLKEQYTIVFVTHDIQQAKRIADHLVFLCDGRIIEAGPASTLFTNPSNPRTKAYLDDEICEC